MRKLFILFLCFGVVSCATNFERGNTHYQKKEYDQAAYYWNPLAKQGNPYAQYNVGLLWEYGFGSTSLNKAQAAEWYLLSAKQGYAMAMVKLAEYQISIGSKKPALTWLNLAARWGNDIAIKKLRSMGEPVPRADLLDQQIVANQRKQKENEDLAAGLLMMGTIIGAANSGSSQSYYPTTNTYTNLVDSPSMQNICNCKGYAGPGGPCYAGPGGAAYNGPGGPAYDGPGGACYSGAGGPEYSGPGGPAYDGPGGPRYSGPGGPAYNGPGGPAYDGPGGACYSGPGGPCYSGPGGTGENCPSVCQ